MPYRNQNTPNKKSFHEALFPAGYLRVAMLQGSHTQYQGDRFDLIKSTEMPDTHRTVYEKNTLKKAQQTHKLLVTYVGMAHKQDHLLHCHAAVDIPNVAGIHQHPDRVHDYSAAAAKTDSPIW